MEALTNFTKNGGRTKTQQERKQPEDDRALFIKKSDRFCFTAYATGLAIHSTEKRKPTLDQRELKGTAVAYSSMSLQKSVYFSG